ncbi:hypothetical protein BDZ89DRAFT_1140428 [Hymenopellis radicata]|nr:hypothetical protein BDZ89DRAFT_1140428 [Hymenopellis radicata]
MNAPFESLSDVRSVAQEAIKTHITIERGVFDRSLMRAMERLPLDDSARQEFSVTLWDHVPNEDDSTEEISVDVLHFIVELQLGLEDEWEIPLARMGVHDMVNLDILAAWLVLDAEHVKGLLTMALPNMDRDSKEHQKLVKALMGRIPTSD